MAHWILLGNPANRRITAFCAALSEAGQTFEVCSWSAFLADPRALPSTPEAFLRLDSTGEDPHVEQALLRLGRDRAEAEGVWVASQGEIAALPGRFGAILAPRQLHLGFLEALDRLDECVRVRPGWTVLTPTPTVRLCFDKRESQRFLAGIGVPVAPSIEVAGGIPSPGPDGVVIKLASGSSASCLGIWRKGARGPELYTSIEHTPTGLYNSLRPRAYSGRVAHDLVRMLLREGAHVEAFIPKAEIDGQNFDLRVLLVGGAPAFTIVRRSPLPITNLHLGGTRADPGRLAETVPASILCAIDAAMYGIGAALPALHLGVDVMIERDPPPGSPGFRVLEVNAFGDLLPNLTRRAEAREWSVYDWEIHVALGSAPGSPPQRRCPTQAP